MPFDQNDWELASDYTMNTTFEQSTQPSSPHDGDLWFDTSDGNHQYRYSNQTWVDVQDGAIETASTAASEAKQVAEAIDQHFWADTNGVHVTEVEQDDWNDSTSQDYHSGPNSLINSLGMLIRNGLTNLMAVLTNGISIYDGSGNNAGNVIASFTSSGSSIGYASDSHVMLNSHSLRFVDGVGNVYFDVSDLRTENGQAFLEEIWHGDGTKKIFPTWESITSISEVLVDGVDVTSSVIPLSSGGAIVFPSAPAAGTSIVARYYTANLCNTYTLGTRDQYEPIAPKSCVLGEGCAATYPYSLAEGMATRAMNYSTHAEGDGAEASGFASHAEGQGTVASGSYAHAEGIDTIASGMASHAQNGETVAASWCQTAIGRGNIEDSNDTYALIIGNGSSTTPSNALTVDWSGNVACGQVNSFDVHGINVDLNNSSIRYITPVTTAPSAVSANGWHIEKLKDYTNNLDIRRASGVIRGTSLNISTAVGGMYSSSDYYIPLPEAAKGVLSVTGMGFGTAFGGSSVQGMGAILTGTASVWQYASTNSLKYLQLRFTRPTSSTSTNIYQPIEVLFIV